jgi:hypothetical protein
MKMHTSDMPDVSGRNQDHDERYAAWAKFKRNFRLGNWPTGNYSIFEESGFQEARGDARAWDDLYTGFESSKIPGANTPTWGAFRGNLNAYSFAVNDYLEPDCTELMHRYAGGTDFEIHIHWVTNGLELVPTYVRWEVEYTAANGPQTGAVGDQFPVPTVVSAETTIPANTADRTYMYTSITTPDGSGFRIGAGVKLRIRRIAATGGAAPAANPFGLMLGIHIRCNTIGSRSIRTK